MGEVWESHLIDAMREGVANANNRLADGEVQLHLGTGEAEEPKDAWMLRVVLAPPPDVYWLYVSLENEFGRLESPIIEPLPEGRAQVVGWVAEALHKLISEPRHPLIVYLGPASERTEILASTILGLLESENSRLRAALDEARIREDFLRRQVLLLLEAKATGHRSIWRAAVAGVAAILLVPAVNGAVQGVTASYADKRFSEPVEGRPSLAAECSAIITMLDEAPVGS